MMRYDYDYDYDDYDDYDRRPARQIVNVNVNQSRESFAAYHLLHFLLTVLFCGLWITQLGNPFRDLVVREVIGEK